jgi:cell fate (sporulation/competence/biofilm development) regulator YlbF (YheA/YmcA/DUF963 family)
MMRESEDFKELYEAFGDISHKNKSQDLYKQATEFMECIKNKYNSGELDETNNK